MGREIKFRAWCSKGKVMRTPCEVYASENGELYTRTGYKSDIGYQYHIHQNIMQYTGLKDVNENEAYDRDIVQNTVMGNTFLLMYNDYGNIGLMPLWPTESVKALGFDFVYETLDPADFSTTYVIIGNEFENPDLLKGGSQ